MCNIKKHEWNLWYDIQKPVSGIFLCFDWLAGAFVIGAHLLLLSARWDRVRQCGVTSGRD